MKTAALLLFTSVSLMGCATAPKPAPVQILEVCQKVPPLELDAPVRDWQGQMRLFLLGTLPTPPDYRLHSTTVKLGTTP